MDATTTPTPTESSDEYEREYGLDRDRAPYRGGRWHWRDEWYDRDRRWRGRVDHTREYDDRDAAVGPRRTYPRDARDR